MVDAPGEKPRSPVFALLRIGVSVCAALLSIGLCAYIVFLSSGMFGMLNDFPQYDAAARLIAQGRAPEVYDTASLLVVERMLYPDLQRPLVIFVPPPAALFYLPIALFPPSLAFFGWMGMLVSALAASIYLMKRQFAVPLVGLGWLVAAVVSFGPTFEALRVAQPATLMLLALLLSCGFFRRGDPLVAGVFLALLWLNPLMLAPLVVFFLACRQWKLIAGLAAATAVMTALSLVTFGISGYQNYLHLLFDPGGADFTQSVINPTVRGQLGLIFGIDEPVTRYGALAAMLFSFVACLFAGHKARVMRHPYDAALLVALPVGLVTAWQCHDCDVVLAIPGLLSLFLAAERRRQAFLTLPIIAGSLVYMIPFFVPLHYFYLLQGGVVNPYFLLLFVFAMGGLFSFLTGKLPGINEPVPTTEAAPAEA